jgi:hypothetical protein
MNQTMRYQEILRRLAIIDEGVVQDHAGLSLGQAEAWALDPKTAALVQVGALVAIGAPGVCLEWSTTRRWPRVQAKTRSPACCWRSPPRPGSAGSSARSPMWRTHSGMTSRPRWWTKAIADG